MWISSVWNKMLCRVLAMLLNSAMLCFGFNNFETEREDTQTQAHTHRRTHMHTQANTHSNLQMHTRTHVSTSHAHTHIHSHTSRRRPGKFIQDIFIHTPTPFCEAATEDSGTFPLPEHYRHFVQQSLQPRSLSITTKKVHVFTVLQYRMAETIDIVYSLVLWSDALQCKLLCRPNAIDLFMTAYGPLISGLISNLYQRWTLLCINFPQTLAVVFEFAMKHYTLAVPNLPHNSFRAEEEI